MRWNWRIIWLKGWRDELDQTKIPLAHQPLLLEAVPALPMLVEDGGAAQDKHEICQ